MLSGAAACASNLGVSKMLIGLTVVSVGTSAPEILVAFFAAIDGNPLLAVGNAIGSNIANIGLVLGITAIVAPLPFSKPVRQAELPWLLGATFLALALIFDRELSVFDGCILLVGLTLILWQLWKSHNLFVNKLHADYSPLAYSCLEHWIEQKVQNDSAGKSTLDLSYYSDSDLAKHHLPNIF